MKQSNRSNAAFVLASPEPTTVALLVVLDAVLRPHRGLLVQTAAQHLGGRHRDPEDVVHDVVLAVLEGHLEIAQEPARALLDLLKAVAARAAGRRRARTD